MADNFPQTPGSGRNVATDQVTHSGDTADVQLVRIVGVTGAEGSKVPTDLPAWMRAEDAAHADGDPGMVMLGVRNYSGAGTDGDYSAFAVDSAGSLNVVPRRGLTRVTATTSGLTTASTAYSAGDQVGALMTLSDMGRASGGSGIITGVVLISAADIIGAYDVVLFDASVTLAADNAAFAISDADALKIVAIAQLAGAYDIGNNRVAQLFNCAIPYVCSGGAHLYAALITRLGHTFFAATTDMQLNVYAERN